MASSATWSSAWRSMPDDMRVVILGAGASHGASIPGEVLPPLVNQFFAVADHLGLLREDYGKEALDRLRAEIERTGGDFARAQEAVGVPEFMGHLFALKEFVKEQLDVKPDEYQTTGVDIERLMALAEGELLGRHAVAREQGFFTRSLRPDVSSRRVAGRMDAAFRSACRGRPSAEDRRA